MEISTMCRICLVENVRMHYLDNSNLLETYEKLVSLPFETKDGRPMQLCYICYAKLRNCYQLQDACLRSEEFFTRHLENNEFQPMLVPYKNILQITYPPIIHISVASNKKSSDGENMDVDDGITDDPLSTGMLAEVQIKDEFIEESPASIDVELDVLKDTHSSNFETIGKCETNIKNKETVHEYTKKEITDDSSRKIKVNTGKFFYKCDVCEKSIGNKKALNSHICCYNGRKRHKCNLCHKIFKRKEYLDVHIRSHTGEKPYKCHICDKSFNQKCNFTRHLYIHSTVKVITEDDSVDTNGKRFKCDVCGKYFNQKGNLTRHFRIHTALISVTTNKMADDSSTQCSKNFEIPYKCNMCSKSFSRREYLNTHIRSHTGEKPYKCEICDKRFNQKAHLSTHLRIHTGKKPYKCDICDKEFTRKDYLKNHSHSHR